MGQGVSLGCKEEPKRSEQERAQEPFHPWAPDPNQIFHDQLIKSPRSFPAPHSAGLGDLTELGVRRKGEKPHHVALLTPFGRGYSDRHVVAAIILSRWPERWPRSPSPACWR